MTKTTKTPAAYTVEWMTWEPKLVNHAIPQATEAEAISFAFMTARLGKLGEVIIRNTVTGLVTMVARYQQYDEGAEASVTFEFPAR